MNECYFVISNYFGPLLCDFVFKTLEKRLALIKKIPQILRKKLGFDNIICKRKNRKAFESYEIMCSEYDCIKYCHRKYISKILKKNTENKKKSFRFLHFTQEMYSLRNRGVLFYHARQKRLKFEQLKYHKFLSLTIY